MRFTVTLLLMFLIATIIAFLPLPTNEQRQKWFNKCEAKEIEKTQAYWQKASNQ